MSTNSFGQPAVLIFRPRILSHCEIWEICLKRSRSLCIWREIFNVQSRQASHHQAIIPAKQCKNTFLQSPEIFWTVFLPMRPVPMMPTFLSSRRMHWRDNKNSFIEDRPRNLSAIYRRYQAIIMIIPDNILQFPTIMSRILIILIRLQANIRLSATEKLRDLLEDSGRIVQQLASSLPDSAALGLITGVSKIFSDEILMLPRLSNPSSTGQC